MSNPLKGKVAWITGGGSGIGLAGAIELVKAGAHVVISGRTKATNDSAEKELKALGSAEAILLDVADKKAVKAAADAILAKHGRIDILVNSAGTNATKRNFDVVTAEAWDDVVAINLSGPFLLRSRGAARDAKAEGRAHHQHLVLGRPVRLKTHRARPTTPQSAR